VALDDYVPERLRSRYSLKMVATLALVLVVTLASGVFFYVHVADELRASADADFRDHVDDGAAVTELWVDSRADLTGGLAGSAAVESGDTDRIGEALSAATAREGVAAAHYVDRTSGEVVASSRASAVGTTVDAAGGTGVTVGEPTASPTGDGRVVPFAARASDDHLVVVEASVASLREQLGDGRYATAIVASGGVVVGSDGDGNDTAARRLVADAENASAIATGSVGEETYAATAASVEGTDWRVVGHAPTSVLYSDRGTATAAIVALLYVIAVNLGVLGITVGGNLALALRRLAERAGEIGDGNLDVELATDREDEVGTLYAEFSGMRDSLRASLDEAQAAQAEAERAREEAERREREAQEFTERLEAEAERYSETMAACANGDLTERLDPETDSAAMESIADSFNEMVAELERTVADVAEFADEVASASTAVGESAADVEAASGEVSSSIQGISEGAREQTEDLQATADEVNGLSATVEEVAATTDEVAGQSDRVAKLGAEGREDAEATIEEMRAIERRTGEVVDAIETLTDEIESIGEVTELIDDIADQTSMLALNANIEAARADAEGEGFAVVADEVKDLAEQTQAAVTDIEEIVSSVQATAAESAEGVRETERRVAAGTEAVADLTESLAAVVDGVDRVDEGLQNINETTDEQAASAQEIVAMVDDVAAVAEETAQQADTVTTAARDASESINEVSGAASDLAERTRELRTMLSTFEVDATGGRDGGRDRPAPTTDGGDPNHGADPDNSDDPDEGTDGT